MKTAKIFHKSKNLYQEKFTQIYVKYESYVAKNQLNVLSETEITVSHNKNEQAKIRTQWWKNCNFLYSNILLFSSTQTFAKTYGSNNEVLERLKNIERTKSS